MSSGRLKIAVDRIVSQVGQQVVSRATRAVNEIRNAELEVLSGTRGGKVYRKPHTKRATYTASAPGEPPARRSGHLRLKWNGTVRGGSVSNGGVQVTAELESQQSYSGYLEEGTQKMAARPYKDLIIAKATPKIRAIYSEPYS